MSAADGQAPLPRRQLLKQLAAGGLTAGVLGSSLLQSHVFAKTGVRKLGADKN